MIINTNMKEFKVRKDLQKTRVMVADSASILAMSTQYSFRGNQ